MLISIFSEVGRGENTEVKTPLSGHPGTARTYGAVPDSIGNNFTSFDNDFNLQCIISIDKYREI